MTSEEERHLIEACARAMGYEVTGYDAVLGAQIVAGSEDSPCTDYFNPLHDSGNCAEMEDALDVRVERFLSVYAYRFWDRRQFSSKEIYPDNPTIEQKSAARRLAVCRCVAASVEKEKCACPKK